MSRTKKLLIAYVICAVISWFPISGWEFAELQARYPDIAKQNIRSNSGFAALHAVLGAALWPVMLPGIYCLTGYAEHGWRAVWNLEIPAGVR